MKIKDLKGIMRSEYGSMQWVIVYDLEQNKDIECGCSAEYAIANYGEFEVKKLNSFYDSKNQMDYIVLTV